MFVATVPNYLLFLSGTALEEEGHTLKFDVHKWVSCFILLFPFAGYPREHMPDGLPFKLEDYLELVDQTGRILREDKRVSIDLSLLPILQRLNIPSEAWFCIATKFEDKTSTVIGHEESISNYYDTRQKRRRATSIAHLQIA